MHVEDKLELPPMPISMIGRWMLVHIASQIDAAKNGSTKNKHDTQPMLTACDSEIDHLSYMLRKLMLFYIAS